MPCIPVEQQTHCLMDVLCGEWTWRNSQEQESNFDGNITRCASQRPTTPLNQQTARRIESLHRTTAQTANECSNTTLTTQERKPSNPKRKRFHSPRNNMKQPSSIWRWTFRLVVLVCSGQHWIGQVPSLSRRLHTCSLQTTTQQAVLQPAFQPETNQNMPETKDRSMAFSMAVCSFWSGFFFLAQHTSQ